VKFFAFCPSKFLCNFDLNLSLLLSFEIVPADKAKRGKKKKKKDSFVGPTYDLFTQNWFRTSHTSSYAIFSPKDTLNDV
jgi:hypothetical protein